MTGRSICRLKEESLSEIHFPMLDDMDELLGGDHVLRMEGAWSASALREAVGTELLSARVVTARFGARPWSTDALTRWVVPEACLLWFGIFDFLMHRA